MRFFWFYSYSEDFKIEFSELKDCMIKSLLVFYINPLNLLEFAIEN
jgi:hypothetical protein